MTIRSGSVNDVARLALFNIQLARETENLKLDPSVVEQGVRAVIGDESKGRYFVAEVGGQVVGCLMITKEWSDWRNADIWWLQSVYVDADHRSRGIFTRLYEHVKTLAREHGVCAIRLYVEKHNDRAKKTYAKLGMADAGYDVMADPVGE